MLPEYKFSSMPAEKIFEYQYIPFECVKVRLPFVPKYVSYELCLQVYQKHPQI